MVSYAGDSLPRFLNAAAALTLMQLALGPGGTGKSCLSDVFTYCMIANSAGITHFRKPCSAVSVKYICKKRGDR